MNMMKDIARVAGVSTATVSRVLNGSPQVKPETAAHVRQIIQRMKYYPNQTATGFKSGHSGMYGLILPDISNPFFADFVKQFEAVVTARDQDMMFATTDLLPALMLKAVGRMLKRKVEGIVVLESEIETEAVEAMLHNRVPVVTLDRWTIGHGLSDVAMDCAPGMSEAVKYLKELGHTRIGFIGGIAGQAISQHRQSIFAKALRQHGLVVRSESIVAGNFRVGGGATAMAELLSRDNRSTAVLTANDMTAIGAMRALLEAGLHPGRDVSVVGLDDIALCEAVYPPLTTVHLPMRDIADTYMRAFDRLENTADKAGEQYFVASKLVIRQSTGPALKAGSKRKG